jgi:hypothetical protein
MISKVAYFDQARHPETTAFLFEKADNFKNGRRKSDARHPFSYFCMPNHFSYHRKKPVGSDTGSHP